MRILTQTHVHLERRTSRLSGTPILYIVMDGAHATIDLGGIGEHTNHHPEWAADMLLGAMREAAAVRTRPGTVDDVIDLFNEIVACVTRCVAIIEQSNTEVSA